MSPRRAELPAVTRRHLRGLQVLNETGYDTRAIRRLIVRALRAQGMRVVGAVRVVYTGGRGHHGCATVGRSASMPGLNMSLSLPRDPAQLDVGKFARVIRHEVMHWRGVRHADMTDDQNYCRGACPEWAEGVVIAHRERAVPIDDERREKRLAHARAMLARAERKAKLAATIVKRWKRRVAAAERAFARVEAAVPMMAAADQEEKSDVG